MQWAFWSFLRACWRTTQLEDRITGLVDARTIAREVTESIRLTSRLTIGLSTGILAGATASLLSPLATSVLHNGSTIALLLKVLRRRIRPRPAPLRAPAT